MAIRLPRAGHLRSVPAQLCGIRGGRAAPHMHPQAPGPWRWQQGPRATRTSPNALAQPAPACSNSLPLRAAQIAAAPANRPAAAPHPPRRLPQGPRSAPRPLGRAHTPLGSPGAPLPLVRTRSERAPVAGQPRQLGRGAPVRRGQGPVPGAGKLPWVPPGPARPCRRSPPPSGRRQLHLPLSPSYLLDLPVLYPAEPRTQDL